MSTVAPIFNDKLDAVRQICRQHHVARLELFGSATNERFDCERSDLDFLVEFEPLPPAARANAYFGLLEAMQDLFQRDIDLVETQAVHNPYFKQMIDAQRLVVYGSLSVEIPARYPRGVRPNSTIHVGKDG